MEATQKGFTAKSMWTYVFCVFGVQAIIGFMNTYQAQFLNGMYGMDFMYFAIIILAAKLLSVFADPFIGSLIDRCNFKSGKMKPFILMSSFPFAVLTTIMFIYIPVHGAGMYVYIAFMTVVWNIVMSFADIPSNGVLALLTPHGKERNGIAGISNIMRTIALAAPSVVIPAISMILRTGKSGATQTVYISAAVFFGILGLSMCILSFFGTEEKVKSAPRNITLRQMGKELKDNKMLLLVAVSFILGFGRNMAMGIMVQCAAILLKDGLPGLNLPGENLPMLLGLTAAISGMISVITVPMVNKKLGEKKTFLTYALYGVITCTISFLLYAIPTGGFMRSMWLLLICLFFTGFMNGVTYYIPLVMVGDIVDYREWKTGQRQEGLIFAIHSLSIKLSNAISVAVGIFIIGASGYTASLKETPELITRGMQNIAWLCFILIPGICAALAAIPILFYKIDAKTKEQMHKELAERRAAAGIPADDPVDGEALPEVAATEEKPTSNE